MNATSEHLIPTNDPAFARDVQSGAVLNSDAGSADSYIERRKRFVEMQQVRAEVNSIKGQLDGIQQLLQQLVNGNTK